jgi:hypothetical protein
MDRNLISLPYLACGALIALYAWERFNTPASNRSSTRQTLYWWGCAGYLASALVLFAALSFLLQLGPWRTMLLGPADNPSLPAPLLATLAMTTLLSSVPPLKQLDSWFLSVFLNWAAIPAEVKRRAATMTPQSLSVTEGDVTALRDAYGDGGYGDTLADHLCAHWNDGMESQYRLTRVIKLYDQIRKLAGNPSYSRFFAETADDFAALEGKVAMFLRRSDISLTIVKRLRALDAQAICKELMQERRDAFAEDCRDLFRELALFLARAVLRSESSEKSIVDRLREIGFSASKPMNLPGFPIDSLTVLAGTMFLYLFVVSHLPGVPQQPGGGLSVPCKIALARLASIGLTVWFMQHYSVFRRLPGGSPRYFGYVLLGVIATAASAGVCLIFHLGETDPLGGLGADLPVIVLSGVLCAAVALCCDDWTGDTLEPIWLRFVEAVGCGSVMGVGMAVIYFADRLPPSSHGVPSWMLLGLPAVLGFIVGGWVPHIYRCAHRAAMSERDGSCELPISRAAVQRPVKSSPTLAAGLT